MLIIRPAQFEVLRKGSLRLFEDEMVIHSKEFTPRLCKALGDEQLRVAIRQAMKRAGDYGFTLRGPMRLYIELTFLYGSDFDSDPQYPAFKEVLDGSGNQMSRAEKIYEIILDYQKKVSGPKAVNLRRALEAVSVRVREPVKALPDEFEEQMQKQMIQIFPQKAAYIGKSGLSSIIRKGRAKALLYEFSTVRAQGLIVVLMFSLGHGCTDDPLYPWIARTVNNEKIATSDGRARRLEKRAVTWLDHVLETPWKGEQA